MGNPFELLINQTNQQNQLYQAVSKKDFEQWKVEFSFEALKGLRYGQSFCNHFDITDNLLYYNPWSVDQTNESIEQNYVDRS
jgi:hypothetical protein